MNWTRTTTGIVASLLLVQFVTGLLLAFYYVPSIDHAHQTVVFIDKVVSSGAWIRSLHHYGSQWLSLFIFVHVVQLYLNRAYEHARLHWVAAVLLLALIMSAGATGYSLPWDARAFFSTRIGEGLAGGLPFVGRLARLWMLGGNDISTLTLSRIFALHVLVTPFLVLLVIAMRFYLRACKSELFRQEITRQAVAGGIVFLALAIWTAVHYAPLGPSVDSAPAEYVPRPGAQFLWLYQMLKYLPGGLSSIIGVLGPGIFIIVLLLLPRLSNARGRLIGGAMLVGVSVLVVSMTSLAYISDRNDVRVHTQLQKQAAAEQEFRSKPFEPAILGAVKVQPSPITGANGPAPYVKWCANCHGASGEGATQGILRFPRLSGVANKPRRTTEDIVELLKNPRAYDLEPPMNSFTGKLSEAEMREIADWVVKLK